MKVPFNATRFNPGVPIYMQASMTATSLDIDCVQGKVINTLFYYGFLPSTWFLNECHENYILINFLSFIGRIQLESLS